MGSLPQLQKEGAARRRENLNTVSRLKNLDILVVKSIQAKDMI